MTAASCGEYADILYSVARVSKKRVDRADKPNASPLAKPACFTGSAIPING